MAMAAVAVVPMRIVFVGIMGRMSAVRIMRRRLAEALLAVESEEDEAEGIEAADEDAGQDQGVGEAGARCAGRARGTRCAWARCPWP